MPVSSKDLAYVKQTQTLLPNLNVGTKGATWSCTIKWSLTHNLEQVMLRHPTKALSSAEADVEIHAVRHRLAYPQMTTQKSPSSDLGSGPCLFINFQHLDQQMQVVRLQI